MCAFLQLLTGKGALQQLGFETGLPIQDLDGIVLFIIVFNLVAALLPAKVRTPFLSLNSVLLDTVKIRHTAQKDNAVGYPYMQRAHFLSHFLMHLPDLCEHGSHNVQH